MTRGRSLTSWALRFLTGVLALLGLAIIVGRLAKDLNHGFPSVREGREALVETAVRVVANRPGDTYVSVNGRDPDGESMRLLRHVRPAVRFHPISERSNKEDNCTTVGDLVPIGACEVDNFIRVQYVTTILWRTAIVQTRTAACYGEFLLFRDPWRWRVVSDRESCS